ncbi:MAG: succinyl-diaminopimelate desuccinylase [Rhodoluna sp.]|nr:succinyl-diaminopimelate desuccinylase [Rhodoluna sp.]MBP6186262.1 succinyl-diaminopimelate desuccinylase [Rhodoluna sp.]
MSGQPLNLEGDVVELTRAICDIESVSGNEKELADAIESALARYDHLEIIRDGDAIVARTHFGHANRVIIAGHIDTVPVADNLPVKLLPMEREQVLWGRGTVDMKAGVAVQLKLAAAMTKANTNKDITWVFYDHEEVEASLNGLGRISRNRPDLLDASFAILCEPTGAQIEGGCNGTIRVEVRARGVKAHSARAWMGKNAVHAAAEILNRLNAYEPQSVEVDGLVYRESLNAVVISGGIATNVIPDECVVTINYRFAPSKTGQEAAAHLCELFDGFEIGMTDLSEGARPGLDRPEAAAFVAAVGSTPQPKYGWTDVARFSALGIPAVNFGPGDPNKAHADDENVPVGQIYACEAALRTWLTA